MNSFNRSQTEMKTSTSFASKLESINMNETDYKNIVFKNKSKKLSKRLNAKTIDKMTKNISFEEENP